MRKRYKIRATINQLRSIGIDYPLTNLVGELLHKFPTGFYKLKVRHYLNSAKTQQYTTNFDIPKTMLTEIK